MTKMEISRRQFVVASAAVGGGLMIGFNLSSPARAHDGVNAASWLPPTEKDGVEINAWLTIDPQGIVTVRVPHTDLGQGSLTSVAMLIAEELDVPWADVRAVYADANRHVTGGEVYVNMGVGGSNTVRGRHPHMMAAGASARELLKAAAAAAWGVSPADVTAKQGLLTAGANSGTYGQYASAASGMVLAEEPAIKPYGDWWLLGSAIPRLDTSIKVNGAAVFPIDVRLDGMVYAAVKGSPVQGGKLASYDFEAIKNLPGVISAVELKQTAEPLGNGDLRSAVAVVADTWYRAKTALDLMPITWDFGGNDAVNFSDLNTQAMDMLGKVSDVVQEVRGDPRPLLAAAGDKLITADYHRPYETHVTMMPPAAVVNVTDERVDVWTFTQNLSGSLLAVAETLGRDPAQVFVHATVMGGGFGNGAGHDVHRQAAVVAAAVGKPVKLVWTREEDNLQDRARPPVWGRFSAVLGDDGLPTALLTRTVGEVHRPNFADSAIANTPYQVANHRHERHMVTAPISIGFHRAPGANANGFLIEQFADEMALAGGWDPLDWRLKMTEGNEPWQRVLSTLKEKSGFRTDLPKGQGMGVAVVESHGTICGTCVTVSVSRRGQLRVENVLIVPNSGYVINTLNGEEQMEGSVIWELSHVLYGGQGVKKGQLQNLNFDTYKMARINEVPTIQLEWALSKDQWWGGLGEPAVPPLPPAISNAIFFATGKRPRVTPIMSNDLSWSA